MTVLTHPGHHTAGRARCGPSTLDPATRAATVEGSAVPLSHVSSRCWRCCSTGTAPVVTRTELLDHVWDSSYDGVSDVVDVYVRSLRDEVDRRFGVELIHPVRGTGYRVTDTP